MEVAIIIAPPALPAAPLPAPSGHHGGRTTRVLFRESIGGRAPGRTPTRCQFAAVVRKIPLHPREKTKPHNCSSPSKGNRVSRSQTGGYLSHVLRKAPTAPARPVRGPGIPKWQSQPKSVCWPFALRSGWPTAHVCPLVHPSLFNTPYLLRRPNTTNPLKA